MIDAGRSPCATGQRRLSGRFGMVRSARQIRDELKRQMDPAVQWRFAEERRAAIAELRTAVWDSVGRDPPGDRGRPVGGDVRGEPVAAPRGGRAVGTAWWVRARVTGCQGSRGYSGCPAGLANGDPEPATTSGNRLGSSGTTLDTRCMVVVESVSDWKEGYRDGSCGRAVHGLCVGVHRVRP
jgi:hypothetical protein